MNAAGTSSNSNTISVLTIPAPTTSAPTNVEARRFTINWNAVSGATSYVCEIATVSNFSSVYTSASGSNTSATFTAAISPNTTHYYRVRAVVSGVGSSLNSTVGNVTTLPASAVDIASPTNITATSFLANWYDVGIGFTFYLDVSTSNNFSTFVSGYNNLSVGTATSFNVTGLSPGATYYYRVRAVKTGTTLNSNVMSVVTFPQVPVAINANDIKSTAFDANWNVAAGATSYRFDLSTTNDFLNILPSYNDVIVNGTVALPWGLQPNTRYYYRVRAVNEAGTTANSNVIEVLTTPMAPIALLPTAQTISSFQANWNLVSGISNYRLDVATDPSFTSYILNDIPVSANNYLVSALQLGKIYYYRVRAVNASGSSSSSSVIMGLNLTNNFVKVTSVTKSGITSSAQLEDLETEHTLVNYQFYDGLGRPNQMVNVDASPSHADIVQPVAYDALGRQSISYLPYTTTYTKGWYKGNFLPADHADYTTSSQYQFYQNTAAVAVDSKPYAETIFEPSPLNRIIKQGAPGSAWQPDATHSYLSTDHTIKKSYESNIANEVLNFEPVVPNATYPTGFVKIGNPAFYNPNQLIKTKTKDEQGNEVIEFVDKEGRVILKKVQADVTTYAQTYYVYDDFGNLSAVMPPEATKNVLGNLNITWANVVGVTVSGTFNNTLTKTGASGYSSGGATFSSLGSGQDGWVEMVANETNKSRMIGLTSTNAAGTNLQFALEFRNDGNIYVWETNVVRNSLGSYTTGTVVRVAREGTQIKYYVDGVYKQTSAVTPSASTLIVDCALNETGATIQDVRTSFPVTSSLTNVVNNYAFLYTYDARKRMSQKKLPGVQPVYMVYDNRDRLVLTQDGNQRKGVTSAIKYWTFTKYDELNRPIATGIKDTTTSVQLTQAQMQAAVDAHYAKPWTKMFETYVGNAPNNLHGYSNKSYPVITTAGTVDDKKYLTVTYYDNYQFRSLWLKDYSYVADGLTSTVNGVPYNQPAVEMTSALGFITGTKVKVLDGSDLTWLRSVTYYDQKFRVIQSQADNYKGGIDRVSNLYDFSGKVLSSKSTHVEQDVNWKDYVGVVQTGNILKRSSAANSGALSSQLLPAGHDGWIEGTYSENNYTRCFGLNDVNTDISGTNLNYAIHFVSDGSVAVYENGVVKKTLTGANPGDVFRIARTGTVVKYYHNNVEISLTVASTASTTSLTPDCYFGHNLGTLVAINSSFGNVSKTITRRFVYDHAGRLVETWHKLDNDPEVRLVLNTYNELGQLVDKKLHSSLANASDAKQSVDYRYNIRGWLTSINNAALATDGTNDDTGDLFGMNLAYNDVFTGLTNSPAYNGNISSIKWSHNLGRGAEKENAYNYSYDAMNRLLAASHKKSTGTNIYDQGLFNEDGFVYDLNGNITKLKRGGEGGLIDDLTYNYTVAAGNVGNQLLSVTDATGDNFKKGFKDDTNSTVNDYKYDENGNMIYDLNKGIGQNLTDANYFISYNLLNLPEKVRKVGNSVQYIYDATGRKLSQVVTSGFINKQTDYAGEFQYEDGALQFISHEEGRIVATGRQQKVFYDGEGTQGILATSGASLSNVVQNGEKYLLVTSNGSTAGTGVASIGGPISVNAGERYMIRAKGYRAGANAVYLLVKAGGVNLNWVGHVFPGHPDAESWVEQTVTIPGTGVTTLEAGIAWSTTTAGQTFYLNEFEVIKLLSNAPEYQYHLKDHLGNVRLTFTSKREVETDTATYEETRKIKEQGKFLRYSNAKRVYTPLFDHTNGSADGYAQRLSGHENEVFGLAKSLSVAPGDTIHMEVYAKYVDANQSNHQANLTALLTQIAGNSVGVVYYDGAGYAVSTSSFPFAAGLNGTTGSSGTGPKAYLNWLVFDKDYNLILSKSNFKRMTTYGREYGQNGPHELLNGQITIDEPGYVYIYLSNEEETNPYEVYFDDFKVEHIKSPVIQMDDYYAFGLTFNSFQRDNTLVQQFKYNGNELQNELGIQWTDYGFRMYNSDIGRWFVIDPLTEKHKALSPYTYVLNNPILYIDVLGLDTLKEVVVTASRYNASPDWYLFMQNLGDQGYNDFIYALYQHKLDGYRTALGAGLYGRDSHGEVIIPDAILEREHEEAEEEALPLLAALWAMEQSGVDPNSAEYLFNPLAQASFLTSYMQTGVSAEEAKKIVASVGIQVGLAWLGSMNIKSPNSFFVNKTKSKGGGITIFQVKNGKRFRVDFDRVDKLHYHRRGVGPGQGIGRHRPWEKKATDKSILDRF